MGKMCIEVDKLSKITSISEGLCIDCNICTKSCPFEAIEIINLPSSAKQEDIVHRYGPNSFELHRLPTPRPGEVLGLVGRNGTGKSTALQLLHGRIIPNLGKWDTEATKQAVLTHFRGSELQTYFSKLFNEESKVVIKPQYVDSLSRTVKGKVGELLARRETSDALIQTLELQHLLT
jgi:ATP-binding cassette subfamily E protein 1